MGAQAFGASVSRSAGIAVGYASVRVDISHLNFVQSGIVTVIAGAGARQVEPLRASQTVERTFSFAGCTAFVAGDTAATLV